MPKDFYDKVARKFGSYSNPARYIQEFPSGEPEKIFKEKLLELSGKEKTVLDSGCGDGRFTLLIAPRFKKVIGNDTSKLMLQAAVKLQKKKRIKNVEFIEKPTSNLGYPGNYFDVIYAKEFYYNEYYLSHGDLDIFLQGVPIFEDYNSAKDAENLRKYVKKYETDKGIKLERHRVVIVAKKLFL